MTGPTPPAGMEISDEARRAADMMNDALAAGMAGHWLAIRLSDGGTDGKVYEWRKDAVKFQMHEKQCMYLQVPPMLTPPADMQRLLENHRQMYAENVFMLDPQAEDAR